ncbi:hypothetical protein ENBRE01_1419 [Enteropsectra breve]|nr:hypothetical protein ENBRE01_1419 [Enteropsectra breve]
MSLSRENVKALLLIYMGYCISISTALVIFLPVLAFIFRPEMLFVLILLGFVVNALKFYIQHRILEEATTHKPLTVTYTSDSSSMRYNRLDIEAADVEMDGVSVNMSPPDDFQRSKLGFALKVFNILIKHVYNLCTISAFGLILYHLLASTYAASFGLANDDGYQMSIMGLVVSVSFGIFIMLNSVYSNAKYVFSIISAVLLSIASFLMLFTPVPLENFTQCVHKDNLNVIILLKYVAVLACLLITSVVDLSTYALKMKNTLSAGFKTGAMVTGTLTALLISFFCDFQSNVIRKDMFNLILYNLDDALPIKAIKHTWFEYLDGTIPLLVFSVLAIVSPLAIIHSYKRFFMEKLVNFGYLGNMAVMSLVFGMFIGVQAYLQFAYELYMKEMLKLLIVSHILYSYVSWMAINYKSIFKNSKRLRNVGYVAVGTFSSIIFLWVLFIFVLLSNDSYEDPIEQINQAINCLNLHEGKKK